MFNGVWEYIGMNGLFLHSGNYGAWFIQNGAQADTSTEEGKALNYDAVNSSAVVGTRLDDNRRIRNVIHSADEREEKDCYHTADEFQSDDSFSLWFIDRMGMQVGEKIQEKRIGR